jgi:hypothetical protein
LNINQVALVRHNSSFMLKDYSNNNDARDHVMQDDSFVGGRGDNLLMRNLLKQSKIKTEGGVSGGGKTPTLSFAGDDK